MSNRTIKSKGSSGINKPVKYCILKLMPTSTLLSVNNQKGFAHIFILFVILLVIVVIILIFFWLQASKTLNLTQSTKTQYKNPFSEEAKYENPFETYQKPYDILLKPQYRSDLRRG